MRPGPDILYACSACDGTIAVTSWLSGNTLVSIHWSDGYADEPDMPPPNWFAPCPRCKDAVWLEDCRNMGEDDRPELDLNNPAIHLAAAILRPQYPRFSMGTVTIHDIEAGLLKAADNTARQPDMRILLMHRANHARRMPSPTGQVASEFCSAEAREANLLALAALLETMQDHVVLLGEVHRELGDFGMAMITLSNIKPQEAWAARQISDWVSAGDRTVRILESGDHRQ